MSGTNIAKYELQARAKPSSQPKLATPPAVKKEELSWFQSFFHTVSKAFMEQPVSQNNQFTKFTELQVNRMTHIR